MQAWELPWPSTTDLPINRDHLHTDVNQSTKYEIYGVNHLGDSTYVIEWFAGMNCVSFYGRKYSFTVTCQGCGKTGICDP